MCSTAVLVISSVIKKKKSLRKKRKQMTVSIKPWLNRRNKLGVYNTLLRELRLENEGHCKKFLRKTPEIFDDLLNLTFSNIYFGYIKAQSVNLYQRFVRQFTRD